MSRHLVVVGPTASGKSALAMSLAESMTSDGVPTEIVSADSMQVYRGMDIGTAKPSRSDQTRVAHHLIDVVDPWEEFSVAEFKEAANSAIGDIECRGARAIVVGGTGLYLQALVDGFEIPGQFPDIRSDLETIEATAELHRRLLELDPVAAARMEPSNRRRVIRALEVTLGSGRRFSSYGPGLDSYSETPFDIVGLAVKRTELTSRIRTRLEQQMAAGFLDEVKALRTGSKPISRTASQALGYRELGEHLDGARDLEATLDLIAVRTRQFAVRQIKWFRRDPRIEWFEAVPFEVAPYEASPYEASASARDGQALAARVDNHWHRIVAPSKLGQLAQLETDDREQP